MQWMSEGQGPSVRVTDYVTATGRYRSIRHAKTYIFNLAKSTLLRRKRADIAGSNSLWLAGRQKRTSRSEPILLQVHFLQSTGKGYMKEKEMVRERIEKEGKNG